MICLCILGNSYQTGEERGSTWVMFDDGCAPLYKLCYLMLFAVPADLSMGEKDELLSIRRRKKELLDDIEVLCL